MKLSEKGRHKALKFIAEKILRGKGFNADEIKEEYAVSVKSGPDFQKDSKTKTFIIDSAGIKDDYRVAIEVGNCKQSKLILLGQIGFDEVIHLPYGYENLLDAGSMDLTSELYDVIKERDIEIKKLKKELHDTAFNIPVYKHRMKESELSYLLVGTLAEMFSRRSRRYEHIYTSKFSEPSTAHEKRLRNSMNVLADTLDLIYDTKISFHRRGSNDANDERSKRLKKLTESLEVFIEEVKKEAKK